MANRRSGITSSDSAVDRAAASAVGATSYFRKPLTLDEYMGLGSIVKNVMCKQKRTEPRITSFDFSTPVKA